MALTTALHDAHVGLGATFTEFAGYDMPVHYGSIKDEHFTVRQAVGLFDVSHMSNVFVSGPDAGRAIAAVTPKDAAKLAVGRGLYSVLLREDGTILDDTFVFRLADERFLVIPNAGRNEDAVRHLRAHGSGDVTVDDQTRNWSILALQGPKAADALAAVGVEMPKRNRIAAATVAGRPGGGQERHGGDDGLYVSGTGYTGEPGVEFFVRNPDAPAVWDALLLAGAEAGIRPIGLGARDTLRLEKGYCLAGNEFAGGRTPIEANLGWLIDWDHDFLGKAALVAQKDAGDHEVLRGLVMERGIPRPHYAVQQGGKRVGEVTSGTQSPTLGKGIGLAYLRHAGPGDVVQVDVRGRALDATVAAPPFA